jgi:predicted  nucleic acid-binding Zn-ribbon protein
MFGRRKLLNEIAELKRAHEDHRVYLRDAHASIATLRARIETLDRELTTSTIDVGGRRVDIEHAVQALADAHDMATVDRHLTLRHHRQGEAHGRAINEW